MVDYIVPGGVITEQKIKEIIATLNDLSDKNVIQKLDKLGVDLDDYLALCEEEKFRHQVVANAFYMFVIPNTARFLHRHMVAAMKGGRGSARVVLKLWASFNKFLEASAYDKRGGDQVYLDFRQMSQDQLEGELGYWQKKLVDLQTIPVQVSGVPPLKIDASTPPPRPKRGRPPRVKNDEISKPGSNGGNPAKGEKASRREGTAQQGNPPQPI
jgi:hypothetical protein